MSTIELIGETKSILIGQGQPIIVNYYCPLNFRRQ